MNFNFISGTWRVIREVMAERDAFIAIIGISWFWLVGFTFLAQFPAYARNIIGADAQVVTLFLTLFSIGIALGSLICNRLLRGKISAAYVPAGALGMTTFIAVLWLASPKGLPPPVLMGISGFMAGPESWLIVGGLLGIAIFGGIYIVPLYTIMQTRCARGRRSRTVAANNILNALFMVLGAVAAMAMLKLGMPVTDIFLTLGVVNIPLAFFVRRELV